MYSIESAALAEVEVPARGSAPARAFFSASLNQALKEPPDEPELLISTPPNFRRSILVAARRTVCFNFGGRKKKKREEGLTNTYLIMSKAYGYKDRLYVDHHGNYGDYAFLEDPKSVLYGKQKQVPLLPIPSLEHSLTLFLRSAKPHVSEAEFENTKQCVEEMLRPNSLARELQQRLLRKAETTNSKHTSWFIDWWNQMAYLAYRDSVVHNVTYELLIRDECAYQMAHPTRRAARFVHYALQYRQQVVNGTMQPDMDKKSGLAWEASQHKYVFNCCRIPQEGSDVSRTYAPDLHPHIAVVRKNNFYVFNCLKNAATGEPLSVDELQIQLDRVMSMGDARGVDLNPVGILSAEDRDVWAKARRDLIEANPANEVSLEKIQSSVFLVCLDDEGPVSRRDVARHMLHGGKGTNRFWDKSFQLAVTSNGKLAYTGEHSLTDGMTTTRLVNYVLEKMFKDPESSQYVDELKAKGVYAKNSTTPLLEPEFLSFEMKQASIKAIKQAELTFTQMSASKDFEVLMFFGFGADRIKSFGVSPDAFTQLAIQLAYRKVFGHCRGTYESTQTRTFMHGRTEVTRSVSVESEAFCDAVQKSQSRKQLQAKLVEACTQHSNFSKLASKGMGCDRHLLALKLLIKEGETVPSLYSDPGYVRSGHWAISTSGLVGELMDGWCFGEVVPDGLGIGYSVQNKRLRFSVSSRHRQEKWASRMCQALEESLVLMGELFEDAKSPGASAPSRAKL